jgi:hypothetical protein
VQALLDGNGSFEDLPELSSGSKSDALSGSSVINSPAGDYVAEANCLTVGAAVLVPTHATADFAEPASHSLAAYNSTPERASSASLFNHIDTPFLNNIITPSNQLNSQFAQQLLTYTAPDTAFLFYFSSLLTYEDFGLNFSPAVKELMQKTFSYASYRYFSLLHRYGSADSGSSTDARRLLDTSEDFSLFLFFDQASRFYSSTLLSPFQHQLTSKSTMLTVDESLSTFRSD